jgi:hypothetical protein
MVTHPNWAHPEYECTVLLLCQHAHCTLNHGGNVEFYFHVPLFASWLGAWAAGQVYILPIPFEVTVCL